MRKNGKYKEIFTRNDIDRIMDEAMENDVQPETPPTLSDSFKNIHTALMDYLDEYETHTFMWAYNLGYAAALQNSKKGGVAV